MRRSEKIGAAYAAKLVVAETIGQVVNAPTNEYDVNSAQIRADAELRIAKVTERRKLLQVVVICVTIMLALWSPVLGAVFGVLGSIVLALLRRVESMAQALVNGARGSQPTAAIASAAPAAATGAALGAGAINPALHVAFPINYLTYLVIICLLLVLLSSSAHAVLVRSSPQPAPVPIKQIPIHDAGPGITAPPSPRPSSSAPPHSRKLNIPQTPEEQAVWDEFSAAIGEELVKCESGVVSDVPIVYVRDFSLSCFDCPHGGIAQKLTDAKTNAPKSLAKCYDNAVDAVVQKYIFEMPYDVPVLDNHFRHVFP